MDNDEREIISGLPRKKEPAAMATPVMSTPLIVGGLVCRVSFECGCTYDRVIKGLHQKQGFHVTPCFAHALNLAPVIEAGMAALIGAQVHK